MFDALINVINLIVLIKSKLDPLIKGVKHFINLMLNSTSWT
jgi:hypothetical protein